MSQPKKKHREMGFAKARSDSREAEHGNLCHGKPTGFQKEVGL